MPHASLHLNKHLAAKKNLTFFDKLILLVSFMYPLSALPQAFQAFQGNIEGVSFISWCMFLVFAAMFFTYGVKHRVLPMIISNTIWMVTDSLVIIGLLYAYSNL